MQSLELKGLPRVDVEALIAERQYSKDKWNATMDFDSKNTLNDWVAYICMYASQAARIFRSEKPELIYEKLIKAANLCLLAAERVRTGERGRRHYDPEYLGTYTPGGKGFARVQEFVSHGGPPRNLPVDNDVMRPGGDGIVE